MSSFAAHDIKIPFFNIRTEKSKTQKIGLGADNTFCYTTPFDISPESPLC